MRVPVELPKAYKLVNHGPTTLVTSSAGGRANVMAAAWVMAIDFDPPTVAAVIDGGTFTRTLIDASGEFGLSLPVGAQADLTWTVGKTSGRDLDKFAAFGIATEPASTIAAPLIAGCAGWLECRVLPDAALAHDHDLFLAEVVAAWADDALFVGNEWRFPSPDRATIHHLSKGTFFATGPRIDARLLSPRS